MITGINHITLSVTNLERAFDFYQHILGAKPLCRWHQGAYLTLGNIWLCLNYKPDFRPNPHPDYTHIAWNVQVQNFTTLKQQIITSGAHIFQDNSSEGESLYFCDPDGHKLEIHVGTWQTRLATKKLANDLWQEVEFFV